MRWTVRFIRGAYASLRQTQLRVLLAGAVLACCLWAFHELAEHAHHGTAGFDERVFALLHDPANPAQLVGPHWLPPIVRDFTSLGSWAVLLLIIGIVVIGMLCAGRRKLPLLVLGSCLSGMALGPALKAVFTRDRPGLEYHSVETFTSSFPSGHSMNAAVVYLTLGAMIAQGQKRRLAALFALGTGIGLAVLVGCSRVYLGVHWPTDVLGGLAAGFGWATLWWLVADRVRHRRERLAASSS
jgi:undecaprenyl-diphosphatase